MHKICERIGKRKGFVFSLIALLLLIPLVLLVLWNASASSSTSEQIAVRIKGGELANFATSISQDSQRALEISGKSAVVALTGHVVSEGVAADNSSARLLELMLNTSYNGVPSVLMQNNSLTGWVNRLENRSWAYGLNASLQLQSLSVECFDAFSLLFSMKLAVDVRSPDDSMNFSRVYDLQSKVSVEGLEDVSYPLNSFGLVKRQITANATRVYGVDALQQALEDEVFVPSSSAPGYLDRLEGRTAPSGNYPPVSGNAGGFESFIDPLEFFRQGIPIFENASAVDYYYFNETKVPGKAINQTLYPQFTFDYFAIDDAKAAVYGVQGALVD